MRITQEYLDEIRQSGRNMLRPDWKLWNPRKTDSAKNTAPPAPYKEMNGAHIVALDTEQMDTLYDKPLGVCIANRRSVRKYSKEPIGKQTLSYLLWHTGRIQKKGAARSLRPVPSAGACHCLETYVYAARVADVPAGLYHYHPAKSALELVCDTDGLADKIDKALFNQMFGAAAVFLWTAVPYRMEYRYSVVSHKMIAIEAGHICQNLYLAAQAAGCGCCAISAYDQKAIDAAVGIDGEEEFTIYAAVAGGRCD